VVIDAGDAMVARMFLDSRELVTTVDASAAEVVSMIAGLTPTTGVMGAEWDGVLVGHTDDERLCAKVYTLAV
jgi:hypothetical protein